MRGFIAKNGKFYTDDQRKAMFAGVSNGSISSVLIKISDPDIRRTKNRFVLPAVAAGASLAPAMTSIPASGVGTSIVGAGFTGLAGGAAVGSAGGLSGYLAKSFQKGAEKEGERMASGAIKGAASRGVGAITAPVVKPLGFVAYEAGQVKQTVEAASKPGAMLVGTMLGSAISELDGLGAPYTPTNSEMMMQNTDAWGLPVLSKDSAWSIDVDRMRDVVRKQYPDADVDAKVVMLPPDDYMKVALKDNPGRESEAIMSNGFYSPTKDTTYIEADDKLNTTRALIHEYAHDMSDDGVEDYMLNEGYADFIAKSIMEDELKIPSNVVNKTLGYPKEVRRVQNLVDRYGRENVDKAFLKYHTLDYLKSCDGAKMPLLT